MKQIQTRNPAMDVVRCFAFFSVISTHFFINTGFYDEPVSGWLMYFMVLVRSATRVCVPLFLLLSGYLMNNRSPIRHYYQKLSKTVVIYILCSICCLLYRYIFLHQPFSLIGGILDTLCYSASPYSWYIEMYLGLFLIIPFLNILYRNISDKKGKQLLILVLLVMTALPSVVNIYNVSGFDWWLMPSSSDEYIQIIPQWWGTVYPITYYFIGCYLKEYPVKLRLRYCGLLLILTYLIVGTFNYYRSYGSVFIWGPWQTWEAAPNLLQSVLVFVLLSKLNYQRIGAKTAAFLGKLSNWSLGAYLLSWIFEQTIYPVLARIEPNTQLSFFYMPVVVVIIGAGSLALSALVNLLYSGIEKLWGVVKPKRKTVA